MIDPMAVPRRDSVNVPIEAIDAAAEALLRLYTDKGWNAPDRRGAQEKAEAMVRAAAPFIVAAIVDLADEVGAVYNSEIGYNPFAPLIDGCVQWEDGTIT